MCGRRQKGKGCVCWEARDVCVLGSHEGRARERRRQQGMCVGVGQGMGRGRKALKGEVVQGIHGRKRSSKERMRIGKEREEVEKGRNVLGGAQGPVRSN